MNMKISLKGKNLTIVSLVILLALVAGAALYFNWGCRLTGQVISLEQAQALLLNYVNKNVLRGKMEAKIGEAGEESGLYKFQIQIAQDKFDCYLTKDGKLFFPQVIDLEEAGKKAETASTTLGDFSVSGDEVCQENGKPILYFFGSQSCPHCTWEHPVVEEVAKSFEGYISFHNNMDTSDDRDVFTRYSTGGIPTVVLGCKYFRVGSGEQSGKEDEAKVLTALLCSLTGSQPTEACGEVQDLLQQIK